jgi:hypothetical protein
VNSPALSEPFTIYRTVGSFQRGGWVATESTQNHPNPQVISARGVVTVLNEKELDMVPEGDRVKGAMKFFTTTPLYLTSSAGANISDKVLWNGDYYRLVNIGQWGSFGFYTAVGVRTAGD